MLTLREQLLTLAVTYSEWANAKRRNGTTSLASVSAKIFNDGKTLDRVQAGGDITTANFERGVRWFHTNWPRKLKWPKQVRRPRPVEPKEDAA